MSSWSGTRLTRHFRCCLLFLFALSTEKISRKASRTSPFSIKVSCISPKEYSHHVCHRLWRCRSSSGSHQFGFRQVLCLCGRSVAQCRASSRISAEKVQFGRIRQGQVHSPGWIGMYATENFQEVILVSICASASDCFTGI